MKTIALFLALSGFGSAAISQSHATFVSDPTNLVWTMTHTCATGDNVLLTVTLWGLMTNQDPNNTPTSVTFGTASSPVMNLTLVGSPQLATNYNAYVYEYFGCPSGFSGTVTITLPHAVLPVYCSFYAIALSADNADYSVLPLLTYNGNSALTTSNGNQSITAARANEIIITVACGNQAGTHYSGFLGTVEAVNNTYMATNCAGGYLGPTTAGAHTVGWSTSNNQQAVMLSLAIRPFNTLYPVGGGTMTRVVLPPIATQTAIQTYPTGTTSVTGDTFLNTGGWSLSSFAAGNFNGGALFFSNNDGHTGSGNACLDGGGGSYAVCVLKMTVFDAVTPGNTVVVNGPNMQSYGGTTTPGVTTCAGTTGRNNKSRGPTIFKGQLFSPIGCPTDSFTDWWQQGWIICPTGVGCCNYKTWNAHSQTCTSGFWSTTGDAPVDDAGYQWPTHSGNPMGGLQNIDTGVQGDPCFHSTPAGMDPEFVYFVTTGTLGNGYARMPCSAATFMDPTQFTVRKSDGTWSATPSDMDFTHGTPGVTNAINWDRFHNVFVASSAISGGQSVNAYAVSPLPWGPTWAPIQLITGTAYQFQSFVGGLFAFGSARITGAFSLNGPGSFTARIQSLDMGLANPTFASVAQ